MEDKYQEYKYIDENGEHLHTYIGKPLLGTSTVVNVLAKTLTYWAAGLAVEKFGWVNAKKKIKGKYVTINTEEKRLQRASEYQEAICKMPTDLYLKLLDDAYKAHAVKLKDSAVSGTDLHAELENFVKSKMGYPKPETYDPRIIPFVTWWEENVEEPLWSEMNCYSNKLWVGGISDCGVRLKDGKIGVIDFKSAKESYDSHFIQCAGYDLEISENGGFNAAGYKTFELPKPIDFYCVIPFGADEFTMDFRYNVDELKDAFRSCVTLYKVINK